MAEDFPITAEDLDNLRARDERWRSVDLSIRVDAELEKSVIINLLIEAVTRRAETAKDELVFANPADTKKIIALQADAQCAKIIGEVLSAVKNAGQEAFAALEAERKAERENRRD